MRFISVRYSLFARNNRPQWPVILSLALLVTAMTAVALAQKPQATLPRVYIDTTWNPPVGGTTWAAHTAAQFSSALTAAAPGDIIVLDAGTIYSGNFNLPAKSNPNQKWIYIESSAYSSLPAPGTQVSPSDAANMPKIVSPNAMGALAFKDGSNYWRFAGIEVYSASTYKPQGYTPGVYYGYTLIGDFSGKPVTLPDSIVFDRCYVHGDSTHDVQAGIQGNMTNVAVVDSYISDIHMKGTDTQAFLAYYTPGPIKLVDNHLEAAGENVMFGGAGGSTNPYVPSDIQVQYNDLYKPLTWVPLSLPPISTMTVKNSFEIKSAQRVLFDSNTIQNAWGAGQGGAAVLLTVRSSQSGNLAVVNDITITNNVLQNVVGGFVGLAEDYECGVAPYTTCTNPGSQDRWNISNNLITFYDPTIQGGARNILIEFSLGKNVLKQTIGTTRDVVFQHNTAIAAASTPCWASIYFDAQPNSKPPLRHISNNVWILDNVLCNEPTGDWGQQGTSGLTEYMGTPSTPPYDLTQRFYGNVMYVPTGNKVQSFPPHNYATTVPFTYVNPLTGDFQLLTPYWTDTSDGNIAGVQNANLPSSNIRTPGH